MASKGKILSSAAGKVKDIAKEAWKNKGSVAKQFATGTAANWTWDKLTGEALKSGGISSQLLEAIRDGNDKSAMAYLQNKLKQNEENEKDEGDVGVGYNSEYRESHEKLNSDDEFLDALYEKVQDLDNKMGHLLAVFKSGEEREKRAELRRKQNSLSRKFAFSGGASAGTNVTGGGSASDIGAAAVEHNGGAGGEGSVGGDESTFSDALSTAGLEVGAETLLGKLGGPTLGVAGAGFAAGLVEAAPHVYGAVTAPSKVKAEMKNKPIHGGFDNDVKAMYESLGVSPEIVKTMGQEKAWEESMEAFGSFTGAAGLVTTGMALGGMAGGPYGAAGGAIVGSVLAAMYAGWFGDEIKKWAGEAMMKDVYDALGVDGDDIKMALYFMEHGPEELERELKEGDGSILPKIATDEEIKKRWPGVEKAVRALMFGHNSYPKSWKVRWSDWGGLEGNESDPERYAMNSTSRPRWGDALFQASFDAALFSYKDEKAKSPEDAKRYLVGVGIGVGDQADYATKSNTIDLVERMYGGEHIGTKRDPYFAQFVGSPSVTDRPLTTYTAGLAVDLSRDAIHNDAFWKKYGFFRLKGDPNPNRYFYKPSDYTRHLLKQGLYQGKLNDNSKPIIEPGTEPEFLARGGVLRSATSLGYSNKSNVQSLENSRREIVDVVKTGIDDLDDGGWFDEAFMNFMMESVLPGMVGALKGNKELEPGQYVPVNVFG